MAQIILNIPNDQIPRVIDAFAALYDYQEVIDGVPNPETKGEFAKRMLVRWVKGRVKMHEAQQNVEGTIEIT